MHIPDGFLNGSTATAAAVLSAGGLAVALRRTRSLPPRRVPLMGLAAAFVFAAQMLNFPIGGGTSGHLIGGVLCAVLLGPSAAILVITSVLIVQCFVFADGGVLALGANVFNMAIVSSVGGYLIFKGLYKLMPNPRGRLVAVAVASWLSTVVAAVVCAGQLAMSGMVTWSIALPAMAGVHMLIGVGEAVITTLVVFTIAQARPELLDMGSQLSLPFEGDAANPARAFGTSWLIRRGLGGPPMPLSDSDVTALRPRHGQAAHATKIRLNALVACEDRAAATPLISPQRERRGPELVAFGLLLALGLAIFVSPFASAAPDGLDHVAEKLNFKEHERSQRVLPSPIADYHLPGIHSPAAATALAGGIGTVLVFFAGVILARVLVPSTPIEITDSGGGHA